MNLKKEKLSINISEFKTKKVLVIGDVMVDAYYWGNTERISPEAPVPIIEVESTNHNPGGAGNVTLNLSTLGADVSLLSIIGDDDNGKILLDQLQDNKINTSLIQIIDTHATPIKTRVMAQDQQVIRIDQENNCYITDERMSKIQNILAAHITQFDGIILADYNKGLLSKTFINTILQQSSEYDIPVYVDPKEDNFFDYRRVRLFKPNISEFKKAIGNNYHDEHIYDIGKRYLNDSGSDILLITRGADDALLFHLDKVISIPTITQRVHDVSGAGDTVIATFALADLCGANPEESSKIANIAASIVCTKVGVVPVDFNELKKELVN
jgi:D-beta-D-heptose 7-phosphate kinase/D-beta-D-heptose 1-phosphate adenosyltransferase